MTGIPMEHGLILAVILFSLGLAGLMLRRSMLFVLMSLEVMLNAAARKKNDSTSSSRPSISMSALGTRIVLPFESATARWSPFRSTTSPVTVLPLLVTITDARKSRRITALGATMLTSRASRSFREVIVRSGAIVPPCPNSLWQAAHCFLNNSRPDAGRPRPARRSFLNRRIVASFSSASEPSFSHSSA